MNVQRVDSSTLMIKDTFMIAVILSGHGGFASGLAKAIFQVIGQQAQFGFIDFSEEMSTQQLDAAMRQEIERIDSGEGVVFFTDLLGGSPFRCASLISQERQDIVVLTGTNLQMVAEILLERMDGDLESFSRQAIQCGRRGITSLADEMKERKRYEVIEDGI